MRWRDTGNVLALIGVGQAGELQYRRNDHENGDTFYSIWFYPRPAVPGADYTPQPFYYVAWARVPAGYETGPIAVTIHHNVADMIGMRRGLPPVTVGQFVDIEPVMELLGRGFAAAFDARRPKSG